jgi:hypothetical protein
MTVSRGSSAMLREVSLFGALVPSLLLYFLGVIPLFYWWTG